MILAVSAFENPRLRRKSVRSPSDRATISARAARMPERNPAAEASAKLSSAGATSAAKREAAYLEWQIVSSSNCSTPQGSRMRVYDPKLGADFGEATAPGACLGLAKDEASEPFGGLS